MFERVRELLAQLLKVDKATITRDTDIRKDLKADSLAQVEMLFTLEEETGIIVPDDMMEQLTVVGALVDFIEKNQAK